MPSSTERANRPSGMRPLPRPYLLAVILRIVAGLFVLGPIVGVTLTWVIEWPIPTWQKGLCTGALLVPLVVWAPLFYGLSLMLEYLYITALNIRLAERQHIQREAEAQQAQPLATAASLNEQVVTLLRDLNENSLLSEPDKARKRVRLEESRRNIKIREIEQLIAAAKWPAARDRLEDFRVEYPDDEAGARLRRRLEDALKEHQQIEIMTTSEQIRSYMSLGLWEKAHESARLLARKYPDVTEAQKMESVVELEQKAGQREERLRLYREIEHLVTRKHYREAKKAAERLIEQHGDSPEAATLHGQMEELSRNADIETRREMEAQIIEYSRQNRHKEAYEVARLLMEQYPESPQSLALKDQIDKLRERAGV